MATLLLIHIINVGIRFSVAATVLIPLACKENKSLICSTLQMGILNTAQPKFFTGIH
jgi:hypothetical protein